MQCPQSAFCKSPDDVDALKAELATVRETIELRGQPDELADLQAVSAAVEAGECVKQFKTHPDCIFCPTLGAAKLLIHAGLAKPVNVDGEIQYQPTRKNIDLFRPAIYAATATVMRLSALHHRRWRIDQRFSDDDVRGVWSAAQQLVKSLTPGDMVAVSDPDVGALLYGRSVFGRCGKQYRLTGGAWPTHFLNQPAF